MIGHHSARRAAAPSDYTRQLSADLILADHHRATLALVIDHLDGARRLLREHAALWGALRPEFGLADLSAALDHGRATAQDSLEKMCQRADCLYHLLERDALARGDTVRPLAIDSVTIHPTYPHTSARRRRARQDQEA